MQSFLVVSSVLLWVVMLFNLLLTLAVAKRLSTASQVSHVGLNPGTKGPDFTAQMQDGETATLKKGRGTIFQAANGRNWPWRGSSFVRTPNC
jgi:hypothetical protein